MPMSTLPGLAGFQNDLHRVTVNGCDLRYLRTGTGAPVVLLHPLRAQLEYFMPLLHHLHTARFEVIALDLPGHGESGAPHADYTATYFTDAVAGFLEATGVRAAVLVGESIGGAIALALAARQRPVHRDAVAGGRDAGGARRNQGRAQARACRRPARSAKAARRPGRRHVPVRVQARAPAGLPLTVPTVAQLDLRPGSVPFDQHAGHTCLR